MTATNQQQGSRGRSGVMSGGCMRIGVSSSPSRGVPGSAVSALFDNIMSQLNTDLAYFKTDKKGEGSQEKGAKAVPKSSHDHKSVSRPKPVDELQGLYNKGVQQPLPNQVKKTPPLIHHFNYKKKQGRKKVKDMVYNPDNYTWSGLNTTEAQTFPQYPGLIYHKKDLSAPEVPAISGSMRYDPKQKTWDGNEESLDMFNTTKVGLIAPLVNSPTSGVKIVSGMRFDPEKFLWVGNVDDTTLFPNDEPPDPRVIGSHHSDFCLSQEQISTFRNCELQHVKQMRGWTKLDREANRDTNFLRSDNVMLQLLVRSIKLQQPQDNADMSLLSDSEMAPPPKEQKDDLEDYTNEFTFPSEAEKLNINPNPTDDVQAVLSELPNPTQPPTPSRQVPQLITKPITLLTPSHFQSSTVPPAMSNLPQRITQLPTSDPAKFPGTFSNSSANFGVGIAVSQVDLKKALEERNKMVLGEPEEVDFGDEEVTIQPSQQPILPSSVPCTYPQSTNPTSTNPASSIPTSTAPILNRIPTLFTRGTKSNDSANVDPAKFPGVLTRSSANFGEGLALSNVNLASLFAKGQINTAAEYGPVVFGDEDRYDDLVERPQIKAQIHDLGIPVTGQQSNEQPQFPPLAFNPGQQTLTPIPPEGLPESNDLSKIEVASSDNDSDIVRDSESGTEYETEDWKDIEIPEGTLSMQMKGNQSVSSSMDKRGYSSRNDDEFEGLQLPTGDKPLIPVQPIPADVLEVEGDVSGVGDGGDSSLNLSLVKNPSPAPNRFVSLPPASLTAGVSGLPPSKSTPSKPGNTVAVKLASEEVWDREFEGLEIPSTPIKLQIPKSCNNTPTFTTTPTNKTPCEIANTRQPPLPSPSFRTKT
ncbi:hypothetical protein Pelo_10614 [Pelomyxa schiedti]|nr:hypothetical protein Pelo_10614 [Pelomyxa schiedti]